MKTDCSPDSSRLFFGKVVRPGSRAAWRLALGLGAVLAWSGPSHAALVTYTNNDALNTSSFTSGVGVTNWDNGLAPAPGNDYLVPSGKSLRSPTNGMAAGAYTFLGNSLTISGGSLSLKTTNTVTVNNLILTNGTVFNGDTGTPGSYRYGQIAGTINVVTNSFLQGSETNRTLTVYAALSGNGGLTVNSRGTVVLTGSHTYNGPLTISGAMLDMGSTVSIYPSALIVGKDANVYGVTNVGQGTYTTNVYNSTNLVRLGGNLNVGYGPAGDLRVGWRTVANTNNNVIGVLDVSSQPQFTANVGNFVVGYSGASSSSTRASAAGLVYLATNNSIVATNFVIADTVEAVSTLNSLVKLGSGSNYIDSPNLVVGARKQNATLSLPAGGTLVLTNSAGRTDLLVGANDAGTSGSPTSLADFSGGPFTGTLGKLVIGRKTAGSTGGASATLTLSSNAANSVDVNDLTLGTMAGDASGATGVATGTLNLNGGSFKVNNSFTFAYMDVPSGGYGSAAGTLNLNGGYLGVACDITSAGGTNTLNVSGGLLDLQPAGDALPGSITVNNLVVKGTITNASTISTISLSGNGTIAGGATTVSGTLDPGTATTAATLKLGSLTLNSGTTLRMSLTNDLTAGNGINDLLDVTGDLDLGGAALVIQQLGSGLSVGTYRLANYTGEVLNTLRLPSVGRYNLSLATDTSTSPKHLNLVVTGNPSSLLWRGDLSTAWDNATQNWRNPLNNPDTFLDNDNVLFDDSAANANVTLDQVVQPGSIVVSNTWNAYTFSSPAALGNITGGGGLTKLGSGTLTLSLTNDFTGPVSIAAGQVIAGTSGTIFGATNAPTTIAAGASLDVNAQNLGAETVHAQGAGADGTGAIVNNNTTAEARNALRHLTLDGDTTVGGVNRWDVRGTPSGLLQGGTHKLIKEGASSFGLTDTLTVNCGDLVVNNGAVLFESNAQINNDAGIFVNGPGIFRLWRLATPMGRPITLQNGGTLGSADAAAPTQNQLAGTITLNDVGYFDVYGGSTNRLWVTGPVTGPGQLYKKSAQLLILTSTANDWAGGTTISSGTLQIGSGGADGSLPDHPLTNNATLVYNSTRPLTLTAPVSGPGTWTLLGSGDVTLAGQITGASRFNVFSNGNLTVQGTIDTGDSMTKMGDGILTLMSSNSFPGNFSAGSGAPGPGGTSGGIIRLLNPYGFGDPSISKTVTIVRAELRLEGGMTMPTNLYFQTSAFSGATGQGAGLIAIRSLSGTNTIPNPVEVYGGAGNSEYSCDSGLLVFDGPIFLGNNSTRSAIFSGAGEGLVNGSISNGATVLTAEKNGPGTWTFTAANTYSGPTLIRQGKLVVNGSLAGSGVTVQTNATLAGLGTIDTAVTVNAGGTLAPGGAGGTLTINSNLTLQGTVLMAIGRNGSTLINDRVSGMATNSLGGLLVLTNIGTSALQVGDRFQLFSAAVYQGAVTNIVGPAGYTFTDNLAVDGSIQVQSVPNTTPPPPAVLSSVSRSGGNLSLVWQGGTNRNCVLLSSTNVAQAMAFWVPVTTNAVGANGLSTNVLTPIPGEPRRFYRLAIPTP